MANVPLFKVEARPIPGGTGTRRVQVVHCSACPAELVLNVNTRSHGGMADDTVVRKATLKGWRFSRGGRDATCPDCERGVRSLIMVSKLERQPGEVREAVEADAGRKLSDEEFGEVVDSFRLEAVLTEGAHDFHALTAAVEAHGLAEVADEVELRKPPPKGNPSMSSAPPPRQPSRDEKRAIIAKLDEVYVSEEVGYAGDLSDEKVADGLKVPVAWVKALREEFHGENAGNEAGSAATRELKRAAHELRKDLTTAERKVEQALGTLATAERELDSVRTRLATVEERLGIADPQGVRAAA